MFELSGDTKGRLPAPSSGEALRYAAEIASLASGVLCTLEPALYELASHRYKLFPQAQLTPNDERPEGPLDTRLYGDPSYDSQFIRHLLDLRQHGLLSFQHTTENYNPDESDPPEVAEVKRVYRQAILHTALELGFLHRELGPPLELNGKSLEVAPPKDLAPIGEVDALIIPGAAGATNGIRLCGALEALRSGAVSTDHLIMTACDRPVSDPEKQRAAAVGLPAGDTEFELCIGAAETACGGIIWEKSEIEAPYPSDHPTKVHQAWVRLVTPEGMKTMTLSVLSAPINSRRTMTDGSRPTRANTQDTFRAAYPLINEGGKVAICSHDTWIPYQEVAGLDTFGLECGSQIVAFGPQKTNRLAPDRHLIGAAQIVDEIAKVYSYIAQLNVRAQTLRDSFELIQSYINTPIPSLEAARQAKTAQGYRHIPIAEGGELYHEPTVKLADHGIAGQAYYSRPNATTSRPVGGVDKSLCLRRSVVEKLQSINQFLSLPSVTEFFGGEVELYVEDGLRSTGLQSQLFHELIPAALRRQHPDMTDSAVIERRDQIIARPPTTDNPSPHTTGGAVDLRLRFKPSPWTPDFIPGSFVSMGHTDGDTGPRNNPDYFEDTPPMTTEETRAQQHRRLLYHLMTSRGFTINPHEWWHFDYGNQLWAFMKHHNLGGIATSAYFGATVTP